MILATDPSVDLITLISRGGVLVLLLIIIYGGIRQWWVFGWVYTDLLKRHELLREERDAWRDAAIVGTQAAKAIAERERK